MVTTVKIGLKYVLINNTDGLEELDQQLKKTYGLSKKEIGQVYEAIRSGKWRVF